MHESLGASGGLGLIWNHRKINLDILISKNNWISGLVNSVRSNIKFILFNVYGLVSNIEKKQFGRKLVITWKVIKILQLF